MSDQVTEDLDRILLVYSGDPEAGHALEDEVLWAYVQMRALEGDSIAQKMVQVLFGAKRTRWYA